MNARFQEKTSHSEDCVLWFGPLLAGNIKRPSQRLQLPQWSLTCTGPMAGLIKECEWKHDVNGIRGKKKWSATSDLLTCLLMEATKNIIAKNFVSLCLRVEGCFTTGFDSFSLKHSPLPSNLCFRVCIKPFLRCKDIYGIQELGGCQADSE